LKIQRFKVATPTIEAMKLTVIITALLQNHVPTKPALS
jgi:hypothetical protein